jgi:large subunit ribosomal protein L30
MVKKLEIKQIRSAIGKVEFQKRTVRALGLRRLHQVVVQADTPSVRGMINQVKHLVEVKEIGE